MLSRKIARKYVIDFLEALTKEYGYHHSKVMIFGSVAKGNTHSNSDIDVAMWDSRFTGCRPIDCESIAPLLHRFPLIELHSFEENETADDQPFIAEILNHGVDLLPVR